MSVMTENISDIVAFLRGRHVSEEAINWIEDQKIDREVILLMEDAELENYLPSYGDRIALVNFCKSHPPTLKRKQGLFEKLREKLKVRKQTHNRGEEPETSNRTKRRAKQATRQIEIGWIHTESNITKQVRAKQGGGTRKVTINTQAGFTEILKQGKALFFPQGDSNKGPESDFEFDVWDFKQNSLPANISIEEIYNTVKLPILRFYLATQPKPVSVEDDDCDDMLFEGDEEQSQNEIATHINNQQQQSADMLPEVFIVSEDMRGDTGSSVNTQNSAISTDLATTFVINSMAFTVNTSDYVEDVSVVNADTSDPEITFGPDPNNNEDSLSDTLICHGDDVPPTSPHSIIPEVTLVLHHANSFIEMIGAFSDNDILNKTIKVQRVLPDNSLENGCGSGLLRDVFTSIWAEFYERCTLGTTLKVPFLRHDFTAVTWKAIGRILLKGFQDCGYLPLKLAPPFLEEMFFGKIYSDLKTSFLQFLSSQEQDVIRKALGDFDSVDGDDLLEVLNNYECRRRVSAESLPEVLAELSHKELVQKPMFVIDCWREILQPQIQLNSEKLIKMYNELKPTSKKVVDKLHFPNTMSPKEAEAAQYLKKYIKELNEERLGKFLRFCTGSDLLVSAFIEIEFIVQTSFTRRPIGRTCASLLQLSDSYDNFPDFRSEFNSILDSSIWIMDIV